MVNGYRFFGSGLFRRNGRARAFYARNGLVVMLEVIVELSILVGAVAGINPVMRKIGGK